VQYGQEFLLQSATGNFIDWLVGANYYNHNTPDAHVPIWDRQVTADAANFFIVTPDGVPFSAFTPLNGDAIVDFRAKSTNRVWGAFGNAWVNFTDTFRFVGGLRYSDTERWFDDQSTFSIFVPAPGNPPGVAVLIPEQGPGKQHKEWDFLTWRGGFEFEPMADSLLYLSYGRGEQAGGYNFLSVDTVEYANRLAAGETRNQATNHSTIGPFDSEKNYALEGGAKNQFLDSRLQLNLNAYYYNYKDKFITQQLASGVTQTVNAPKALVYGAELTSIYMPTDELRLNGSLGLVHSEYVDDMNGVDQTLTGDCPITAPCNPADPNTDLAAPLPTKNIKGNRLARTPAVTVGLGGEYAFQLSDWGTLTPRVDWYWRDKVYFNQFNDDAVAQGSYSLTNARIRIERADGSYWVELYGTNLGNADKIKTQSEGFGSNPQWWLEEPRMFGVRVGFKYF
jgi:iron complex outermembrane receptor protein